MPQKFPSHSISQRKHKRSESYGWNSQDFQKCVSASRLVGHSPLASWIEVTMSGAVFALHVNESSVHKLLRLHENGKLLIDCKIHQFDACPASEPLYYFYLRWSWAQINTYHVTAHSIRSAVSVHPRHSFILPRKEKPLRSGIASD